MKQMSFESFCNLYPVQKTLRFELKPIGKTIEWIEKKGLINQDEQRAEDYKVVKKLIDFYHKHFIDESLREINKESFCSLLCAYNQSVASNDSKSKEKVCESLRKTIVSCFDTNRLFGKELIKEDLMNFLYECVRKDETLPLGLSIDECKGVVGKFNEFTSYFTGFHENRKNMYSSDEKSTAIAYRLVHENLPKFMANMEVWNKVKDVLAGQILELEKSMSVELNGRSLASLFECMESYAECLTQCDITIYNTLIGGRSECDKKIKGLNEYINLHNQQCDRKNRLPKMTQLYKMILSDRATLSWLPEKFEGDIDLLNSVKNSYLEIVESVFKDGDLGISLPSLLANLRKYNLEGIYIKNDTTLTWVLQRAYQDWAVVNKGLGEEYDNNPKNVKNKTKSDYIEKRQEWIDEFKSFSISDICRYAKNDDIVSWYEKLWYNDADKIDVFQAVINAYDSAKDLLNTEYNGNLKDDENSIELIKSLYDALKSVQRFAHTLKGCGDENGRDVKFYADLERHMVVLDQLTPLYNMVRNYLTQKPYSEDKFKLNFENPQLVDGWDQNKESDYLGVFLRKNGLYYLGIMDKDQRRSFACDLPCDGDCYEKVDYKLLPGANKMLPKVFFSKKSIDFYAPSDELMAHYKKGTHKKGNNFDKKHCHDLIDFFKSSIDRHPDWSKFGFEFSPTNTYEDISGFYREVEHQGYKLSFRPVLTSYVDKLVDNGNLYLFQIYNKDFSAFSKGTPNMHTLYWRALFDEENLKNVVYKLNGKAEVFFRRKSVTYDAQHQQEGYHCDQLKDKFSYPIYRNRRYSMDKFQFHVPITMNFRATGQDNINRQVREFIKAGGVKHIIGIDRGERHLLYLSLIDLKGNIVKQFTLNEIINHYNGQTYKTDYHAKLAQKEIERDKARKNWQTIEGIKELKEGYLSQVMHIISQMMVEYNAIVVLEDLNFGFKRGRQKVERQVYQKFEKMLIDKLNYLVDKKKSVSETGGLLHALQLTSKFESFQKLGKQSGFLFYVPAALTSKIDPVTGFANYIFTKYTNREDAVELLRKFADIRYNASKDYFEFVIDNYKNINPKAVGRQDWVVCSYGNRIDTFRNEDNNNQWDNREVCPTRELKQLFDDNGIDYRSDLKHKILNSDKDAKFFKKLLRLLGLVLQMRNSVSGTEIDYIISPVADQNGEFYTSDSKYEHLPLDADANGAYNIARKGLWLVMQLLQAEDLSKVNLAMSNEEWMVFAQNKTYCK